MSRLENFYKLYESKNTINTYRLALNKFFGMIYDNIPLTEAVERYFDEKRDYEKDVKEFFSAIRDSPPKTVRLMLSVAMGTVLLLQFAGVFHW